MWSEIRLPGDKQSERKNGICNVVSDVIAINCYRLRCFVYLQRNKKTEVLNILIYEPYICKSMPTRSSGNLTIKWENYTIKHEIS